MSESVRKNLFSLFGNMNKIYDGVLTTQGIGLGLTICKQISEFLKGTINISSEQS